MRAKRFVGEPTLAQSFGALSSAGLVLMLQYNGSNTYALQTTGFKSAMRV